MEYLSFEGATGPGKGKHIVFLAGDEEYRSEESLPMLAQILADRFGFRCTVSFSLNAKGEIDPTVKNNQPGIEQLDSADLCVMLLRFREWPDSQMKHFVDYFNSGKPIIALRTSTHAFAYSPNSQSQYKKFDWQNSEWKGGFGKQVLGETWLSHWGQHGKQATNAIKLTRSSRNPLLNGVGDIFGDSDVYEAHPPADAKVLLQGIVLEGMDPKSPAANGKQNDPPMPVAWTREYQHSTGMRTQILTCTMGAATDFLDENLRRFIVNACFQFTDLKVPSKANVKPVVPYNPSKFGFDGYRRGITPSSFLKK